MTTDTNLSQIVFNRLSNEKYHELKTSGQLNDQQFYITPDLDTNPGLIQDYMSNCITKIPQHINLELSTDGTLTLKAGSKVYVPNGVGVFDEVTIQSDKSYTNTNLSNMPHVAFINTAGDLKIVAEGAQTHSGTTAPTVSAIYILWYDTTNNLVKYSTDSGASYYDDCSLPIAVLGVSGNKMTSIDQVFNGMGYIGAVAFAVPGVQVIIPNGFNSNGQLNNYTATVERVLIKDYAADNILGQNLPLTLTNSPLLSAGDLIYVEEENQIYKGSIAELNKRTEIEIAKVTTDSTKITSLTPLPIYNHILSSAQVYETIEESLNKKITNELTANRVTYTNNSGIITTSDITSTELGYLDGVTSNIQTQINAKQAAITGGASTITGSNLTANRALISDGNGKVAVSAVTSTELGYLDGVTSSIQTQLNARPDTSLSNISTTGKQNILMWGIPNYNAGVAKNKDVDYTAESCGYLLELSDASARSDASKIIVNNVTVATIGLTGTAGGVMWSAAFVSKGDRYRFAGVNSTSRTFFPLRGA